MTITQLDTPFESPTRRQSPFDVLAVTSSLPVAKALATAFSVAHDQTDVLVALQFHRAWDGSDLTPWLASKTFGYWMDRSGSMSELAVEDLRELAGEWLEGRR